MAVKPYHVHNPAGSSLAERIAANPSLRSQFLATLSPTEKTALLHAWESFWARPKQIEPGATCSCCRSNWTAWLVLAGRGFGKTRTGAEWSRKKASTPTRGAFVAPTAGDVRDIMVEGQSGIMNVCPKAERPKFEPTKRQVSFPNGTVIKLYSADEPDRIRGPEHHWAWCDELASWRYPEAWDMLMFGLRLPPHPQVLVTTTPRPTNEIKTLIKARTTICTTGSSDENVGNLAESFFQQVISRYAGTRLERQERFAEILDDAPGALWNRDTIDTTRLMHPPEGLQRIVVAIDPPAKSKKTGAECGIIVAGSIRHPDGTHEGFVLEDASMESGSKPDEWARRAHEAFRRWKADRFVAETNQGGDMVEHTLRSVLPTGDFMPTFEAVTATRGKAVRAEPVSALYTQQRIHHVGRFPILEDQMCGWEPSDPESPDRMDALVWAFYSLFPNLGGGPVVGGVGGRRGDTMDRLSNLIIPPTADSTYSGSPPIASSPRNSSIRNAPIWTPRNGIR